MNAAEVAGLLSRTRLLIFDFDGTLVDSSPLHSRAFNEAFAAYGVAVDYNSVAGLTTAAAVDKICGESCPSLTREQRSALILDKQHRARGLIETELKAIEGSIEFLRGAREHFALALCTSASRRTLGVSLKRIGIEACFDSIFAAEDVSRGKPAPDAFLKALDHHRVEPGEALVFEDADSGLEAARAAGLQAIRIVGCHPGRGEATWSLLSVGLHRLRR